MSDSGKTPYRDADEIAALVARVSRLEDAQKDLDKAVEMKLKDKSPPAEPTRRVVLMRGFMTTISLGIACIAMAFVGGLLDHTAMSIIGGIMAFICVLVSAITLTTAVER